MPDDLDLLAEIEDNPERERIAAALALLRQVPADGERTHWRGCHVHHTECLAAMTITTLTGEDRHHDR